MNKKAFTLVELIVGVAITGILMVGMSTFFSGVFRNLFEAQTKASNQQALFIGNEILQRKLNEISLIQSMDSASSAQWVILKNKFSEKNLPFTYIGKNTDDKLVIKDFIPFNKIIVDGADHILGNSGAGKLSKVTTELIEPPKLSNIRPNFGGFIKSGTNYLIAHPIDNKIYQCSASPCNTELTLTNALKNPTDVAMDVSGNLYISDSGNGRIIQKPTTGADVPFVENLNYPTGLEVNNGFLYVAETLANRILKIDLNTKTQTVIAGEGLITLKYPTGLFISSPNLYIADSGNGRILKITDPIVPTFAPITGTAKEQYETKELEIVTAWTGGSIDLTNSNIPDTSTYNNASKKITFPTLTSLSIAGGPCVNNAGATVLHIPNASVLPSNYATQKIKIGSTIYGINSINTVDCDTTEAANNQKQLTLDRDLATTIEDNQTIYFANPLTLNIRIDNPDFGGNTGLVRTDIKINDATATTKETLYTVIKVGNGIIGTPEDSLSEFKTGFKFPTGISTAFISDSETNTLKNYNTETTQPYSSFDTANISNFDNISIYPMTNWAIKKINTNQILNLTFKLLDISTQPFNINAKIPTP